MQVRSTFFASFATATAEMFHSTSCGGGQDQDIGGVVVHVARLDDIIAAKEYAECNKDHEALPEPRELRDTS